MENQFNADVMLDPHLALLLSVSYCCFLQVVLLIIMLVILCSVAAVAAAMYDGYILYDAWFMSWTVRS